MKAYDEKINNKNIIGPRLKKARANLNITQHELSVKLQIIEIYIDRASISKIERQRRTITDYELIALAKVLGISIDWLLETENVN